MRAIIGIPPTSASALSRPKRELAPPAIMYPVTFAGIVLFASLVTNHQSRVTPLPLILCPAAESPARAVSPADSAGAIQSSPRFARHSTDAPPVASSGKPLRIFAWPRENLVRQFRC